MYKLFVAALATFLSIAAVAPSPSAAQDLPPDPSCTVLGIDGLTLTLEIADMRPGSGGEILLFNGIYYFDDAGNLIPNPFGADGLDNGIHEFTLIPGEWSLGFSEWTSDGGFIIGWGCDVTNFVIGDVDPATALRSYLSDLFADGELSPSQYNQLTTQLTEAEAAIAEGSTNAATAHLNNLTRRADHKMFDLDAGQVAQIESYVAEILADLG